MSEAVSVAIAKALESLIAESKLSQSGFTLARNYAEWDLDLSKMDSLEIAESEKIRVDVVSHTTEQELELSSRTSMQFMVPIDIAVRRRFGANYQEESTGRIAVSEIDSLILFMQEIHLLMPKLRTTNETKAVWQQTQTIAAPVREHLRELRQFTGILRVTFRADVAI